MHRSHAEPQTEYGRLVYGIHAVTELLNSRPDEIEKICFDNDRRSEQLFELIKQCRKERRTYQLVPAVALDRAACTTKHQGVVAFCPVKPYASIESVSALLDARQGRGLVLVAASVEDPRNLGSIIRSAVAFGVDALLLEQRNTAPLSSVVAKSAAGMLEHLPVARPRNLESVVAGLKAKGFAVVGAVAGEPVSPRDVNLTGPTVIVTGGEHRGIPPYLAKQCTVHTGIPVCGKAQSLNVSVAAAVLLYECARQRSMGQRDATL